MGSERRARAGLLPRRRSIRGDAGARGGSVQLWEGAYLGLQAEGSGQAGGKREGLANFVEGGLGIAGGEERLGKAERGLWIIGRELLSRAQKRDGFREPALAEEELGDREAGRDITGSEGQAAAEGGLCIGGSMLGGVDEPKVSKGGRVGGVSFDRSGEHVLSGREIAVSSEEDGEVAKGLGVLGVEVNGLGKGAPCRNRIPGAGLDGAELNESADVVRIFGEDLLEQQQLLPGLVHLAANNGQTKEKVGIGGS
ncbi:MAG: hypothetical protein NVSMB62_23390 [Acidobacteriaceae bacterium]